MISKILDILKSRSKKPWASFQTNGFGEDGRIKFEISYNKAFIENLSAHGIRGINDQETVMRFLVASQMLPEEMLENDIVRSEAHPMLQSDKNILREG